MFLWEALGRSKGGFGSKAHALCDALGLPIKYTLTGGQEAECKQATPLLENVNASAVLADKAYDTNELREWLERRGIKVVIPPKSNRKEVVNAIIGIIKGRHAAECMFGKLKHYRTVPQDMRKRPSITWGCRHLPRYFYG
jgi:transposase